MQQNSINILFVAVFIVLYCLSGNSPVQYEELYRIQLNDEFDPGTGSSSFSYQAKALLFDINGDGNQEIIYVTSNMALRVYSIQKSSHSLYSSNPQIQYSEVSLLANSQLRSLNKVIAMEATRITVNSREKGLIAILSNNGIVSCYDESMHLLWKVSIYENSLINLNNVVVTNAALKFYTQESKNVQHVLYAIISYSIGRKHLMKALNERLSAEEIKILKENKITIGSDVDLTKYKNSPVFYIIDKYKMVYDRVISINDMKVLLMNSNNGDIIWKTNVVPNMKRQKFLPIHHNILNQFDFDNKIQDTSDFSQSIVHYFPHSFSSYRDTEIMIQSYQRNHYTPRTNYLDSPFRSRLPLQFLSFLKQSIHQHHQLIQNSIQVDTRGDVENVLVVHSNTGILIIDRRSGNLISDIPLASQKSYMTNSDHLDDVISVFLASQPFTGENNQMNSYSQCFLQAVCKNELLFSTNICDNHRKVVRDEFDEILVLPPLLLLSPDSHAVNQIITLTNEGLLSSVDTHGTVQWSIQTKITWNELDEASHTIPILNTVDDLIYISTTDAVHFYTRKGRRSQIIPIKESLQFPIHRSESGTYILQSLSTLSVYRHLVMTYSQFVRLLVVAAGAFVLLYSVISRQLNKQMKEKLM